MDDVAVALEQEQKVALTALVLVPPESAWAPIQAIRRAHDPQYVRWMPHVTLLYPFVPAARLEEAAERLRPAAASVEPFDVSFAAFGHFEHGGRSVTLWLRPEPAEAMRQLQTGLEAAMPWCDDVSGFPGGFTPHLSVGRFPTVAEAERMAASLLASWSPVECRATEVALIARSGAPGDPFRVAFTLPLGHSMG